MPRLGKPKAAEATRLAAEVESAEAATTCLAVATAAVVGAVGAFARWHF